MTLSAIFAEGGILRPRVEKARDAHSLVKELIIATEGPRFDEALADFRKMGRADHAHAGMVRSIFEEHTGISWRELEERIADVE
jgi:hypothetical protein